MRLTERRRDRGGGWWVGGGRERERDSVKGRHAACREEGGREEKTKNNCSKFMDRERERADVLSGKVTSLYGGPLEFTFIVQSTEHPAYRAVSMLLSELKDEVDVKIVVAGISTTCGQKIHNQLVCT
ncbi:hypothetical protein D8674_031223 [Pyrus ussuriensis x Pyrus communis]|uniref:Uncharacterized protein n=1 Tax=Pyrus ussuriensis x Pyrus communis TaxID=2448454 RepID=A0A5N5EZ48_9ROSA|nr:hypothetical protein D8674_031223 [Pyrus ussuriensis x Pyrus communis]